MEFNLWVFDLSFATKPSKSSILVQRLGFVDLGDCLSLVFRK